MRDGNQDDRNEIQPQTGQIKRTPFGKTKDGATVELYKLRNANGMEVQITDYGGIVVSLKVPDRRGVLGDVVLGYDNLEQYLADTTHFGALIGRYANRIADGRFTLDGATHTLAKNNGSNSLHGGLRGFDKAVWHSKPLNTPAGPALELTHVSPDGDEGFPGELRVTTVYTLTADNTLMVESQATSDKPTIVNLTQHSYFNLAGRGDVLDHELTIHSAQFLPTDDRQIPTGEFRSVKRTPFDFQKPCKVGARINEADAQIKLGRGYDHTLVIDKAPGSLGFAARLHEEGSGRVMELLTTEPGLQFYSGNWLDGTVTGKGGWTYQTRNGLCLEPQHYPNSPNQPEFPSTVLRPGQVYRQAIVYKFSTQ